MSWWDKLPLWEKMLIVLAGAMLSVLAFGAMKLVSTRLKLRKLAKKAEIAKADLEAGNTSQNTVVDPESNIEIPFGIRALEAGVKVEGVQDMSRPSSPRTSFRYSSNMTLVEARDSYTSFFSGVDADSPRSSIAPPSPGIRPPSVNYMRAVHQPHPYSGLPFHYGNSTTSFQNSSACSTPTVTRNPSVENVPTLTQPPLARPPLAVRGPSPSQYSTRRQRISLDGARGYPNVYGPSSSRSPSPPDGSTLPSVREDENISSGDSDSSRSTSDGEDQKHSARSDSSGERGQDLSLLDHHRISHAAEVGQLERRPPGPSRRNTWSSANIPPPHTPPPGSMYCPPSPISPIAPVTGPEGYAYAIDPEIPLTTRRPITIAQFNQNLELAGNLFESQSHVPPLPPLPPLPVDEIMRRAQASTEMQARANTETQMQEEDPIARPKTPKRNKLTKKSRRQSESQEE